YWMGRYLERAENVTRLLLVTEEMASEVAGLDEELARADWTDLRVIFPPADGAAEPPRLAPALGEATLAALAIDPREPYSIRCAPSCPGSRPGSRPSICPCSTRAGGACCADCPPSRTTAGCTARGWSRPTRSSSCSSILTRRARSATAPPPSRTSSSGSPGAAT